VQVGRIRQTVGQHRGEIGAGAREYPGAERDDCTGAFRHGDERARRHEFRSAAIPAYERFHRDAAPRAEVDDRLIVEHKFVACQTLADFGRARVMRHGPVQFRMRVDHEAIASERFRLIERDVGGAQYPVD
jgi:hypothetical protein